jgi:hypothetical protein
MGLQRTFGRNLVQCLVLELTPVVLPRREVQEEEVLGQIVHQELQQDLHHHQEDQELHGGQCHLQEHLHQVDHKQAVLGAEVVNRQPLHLLLPKVIESFHLIKDGLKNLASKIQVVYTYSEV